MNIRLLACAALVAAAPVWAQDARGTIIGRVADPSGAFVAGAKVRATNLATNTGTASVSNQQGNFEIPFLQPGLYRVTVELQGFSEAVRENVEVSVDERLELDFRLEVGNVNTTVVVTAESTMLDTASPSIGMVVDEKQVAELPIAGGNAFYLARLTPGVMATGGHSPGNPFDLGHASGSIVVNGTRSGSSEISVDGASSMSGNNASFSPMQDLVQEFKIQTLAFDASAGHGTGAIVNVSIKAGTNALHGTGSFFDSRIRANPWFYNNYVYDPRSGPVTEEKKMLAGNSTWLHQRWGATMGGPIRLPRLYDGTNKTFWVFGYEGMYVRRQPTTRDTVPTLAEREGDFSALLALASRYQIYDPATVKDNGNGQFSRTPLPGNIVPASRISPVARNLLAYYPKPNAAATADGHDNFFRIYDENKDYRTFLARVDHTFSENHRVYFRMNNSWFGNRVQKLPTLAVGDVTDRPSWGGVIDDVLVLGPRMLLNLRYGFSYMNLVTSRYSQGFDITTLGLPHSLADEIARKGNAAGMAFPLITVENMADLGDTGGSTATTAYHTWFGTLTHLLGSHSLRMGAEFRLMRENGYNYGNVAPTFDFGTTWTKGPNSNSGAAAIGQGFASLLFGLPSGGGVDINASRAEQSTFTGVFFQDDWKATRKLTINMGIRYEYESPTTERYNRSLRGFDFQVSNPVEAQARANYALAPIPQIPIEAFRTTGGLTFPGANGLPRGLWNSDKNNFAPRFGLAYRLNNKTVIRSGYGVFHGITGIDRRDVNQGGFNQTTPFVASLTNGITYRATLSDPFPDGIQNQSGASAGLLTQLGKSATYFNEDLRTLYMQRWTLSVQRQLPKRVVLDLTYVGNRGTKLSANRQLDATPREYLSTSPVRDQPAIDFLGAQVTNPFAGMQEFFGTNLYATRIARSQLLRPYPQFTGITVDLPVGYSYFHSMQVLAQKRFSHGASFQFAYTFSKFMEATSFLNQTDLRPEKVVSDQDHPHRIVLSGSYELPFGRGRHFLRNAHGILNGIIGGWQAQGWYEGQSGQALGFGNMILYGTLQDIPLPVSERKVERWFNTGAGFETTTNKLPASNIRTVSTRFNNIRSDGTNNMDLSVFKTFRITEKLRAQARMESYNSLNHAQFANPNVTPTNAAFGTVTAEKGHGQRQITFAMKLMF